MAEAADIAVQAAGAPGSRPNIGRTSRGRVGIAGLDEAGLHTWVEWATEAADMRAQFITIASVTPAGACHKHYPEGDNYRDDNKPVLHGS